MRRRSVLFRIIPRCLCKNWQLFYQLFQLRLLVWEDVNLHLINTMQEENWKQKKVWGSVKENCEKTERQTNSGKRENCLNIRKQLKHYHQRMNMKLNQQIKNDLLVVIPKQQENESKIKKSGFQIRPKSLWNSKPIIYCLTLLIEIPIFGQEIFMANKIFIKNWPVYILVKNTMYSVIIFSSFSLPLIKVDQSLT